MWAENRGDDKNKDNYLDRTCDERRARVENSHSGEGKGNEEENKEEVPDGG